MSIRAPRRRPAAAAILLCFISLIAPSCSLAAPLTSVRLKVCGHEVPLKTAGLCDGHDVFLPLDALRAFGASATLNSRGDCASVMFATGDRADVALARPSGTMMLPLSTILPRLNATARVDDGVCEVRPRIEFQGFQNGQLRVCAGLPITAACHSGPDAEHPVLTLEIEGADLASDRGPIVPPGDVRIRSARAERAAGGIRLTIETAPGVGIAGGSAKPERVRTLALQGTPRSSAAVARRDSPDAEPPSDTHLSPPQPVRPNNVRPPSAPSERRNAAQPSQHPNRGPEQRVAVVTQQKENVDGGPQTGDSGTAKPANPPAAQSREITGAEVTTTDADHARLKITTSARIWVTSKLEGDHLAVDFPATDIAGEKHEWPSDHPLIKGIRAVKGEAEGSTRVLIDLNRVAEYRILSEASDGVTILLSAPRGAGKSLHDVIVVIDPGHGGSRDCANAVQDGHRVYEKDLTLAIGRKVAELFRAAGVNVLMTRHEDVAVGLDDRPRLANENNADIFLSIHTDDCEIPNTASGTTAYYHMDDGNSRALAHSIVEHIAAVSGLPNRGARSDRVRFRTGMAVLRGATMPATLVELGYINNARDRSKLVDEGFQQQIAQAIFDGITAYVEGPGSGHLRSRATD